MQLCCPILLHLRDLLHPILMVILQIGQSWSSDQPIHRRTALKHHFSSHHSPHIISLLPKDLSRLHYHSFSQCKATYYREDVYDKLFGSAPVEDTLFLTDSVSAFGNEGNHWHFLVIGKESLRLLEVFGLNLWVG